MLCANWICYFLFFPSQVLDVNVLIKPRMEAHKAKQVELHKQEAMESAIATVQAKLREKEESKNKSIQIPQCILIGGANYVWCLVCKISFGTQTLCTYAAQHLGLLPYQIRRVFWFTRKSLGPILEALEAIWAKILA